MRISEFELIDQIRKQVPAALLEPGLLRDDAAILHLKEKNGLMTADTLVEGVDFELRNTPPEAVGQKALGVNLSDIAAMGGKPLCFTIALGIPRGMKAAWFVRFYRGLMHWARRFEVICAGGDISAARELFISITVLGAAGKSGPVLRSGARSGDWIGVTGTLGGSILEKHLKFTPRIREGAHIARSGARAMIDISDGFLQDLGHLLKESNAGAVLDATRIPVSKAALKRAGGSKRKALEYALSDGEDFELIFTLPSQRGAGLTRSWPERFPGVPLTWVGIVTDRANEIGWSSEGRPCAGPKFKKRGYQHDL